MSQIDPSLNYVHFNGHYVPEAAVWQLYQRMKYGPVPLFFAPNPETVAEPREKPVIPSELAMFNGRLCWYPHNLPLNPQKGITAEYLEQVFPPVGYSIDPYCRWRIEFGVIHVLKSELAWKRLRYNLWQRLKALPKPVETLIESTF